MKKYIFESAIILIFAVSCFNSLNEGNKQGPKKPTYDKLSKNRPQVCKEKEYNQCLKRCKSQRNLMCWCAIRTYSYSKSLCQCGVNNYCPPFPQD